MVVGGAGGAIALIKLLLQHVRETERDDTYRVTHQRIEIKHTATFIFFSMGKRLRLERRYGVAVTTC